MAGHSKWANIQHRKGMQDAKRGKLFTRLIREISVASRLGGSDPVSNSRLRLAIDKALSGNMTKDTIERAVKRGAGELEGANYTEVRYEGYGIAGVAVLVDCLTDNRNRTVADVRHAFTKYGGNMGTDGSVAYLFSKIGVLVYPPGSDEDAIMGAALEAGAEDVVGHDDGSIEVITGAQDFVEVKEAIEASGLIAAHAEVTMRAANEAELDREQAEKLLKMLDFIEELDDVQDVYTNAEFPSPAA